MDWTVNAFYTVPVFKAINTLKSALCNMAHKIKAQVFVILCLRRPIYRHCTCMINICEDDLMAWWWGERSQKWNSDF